MDSKEEKSLIKKLTREIKNDEEYQKNPKLVNEFISKIIKANLFSENINLINNNEEKKITKNKEIEIKISPKMVKILEKKEEEHNKKIIAENELDIKNENKEKQVSIVENKLSVDNDTKEVKIQSNIKDEENSSKNLKIITFIL